MAVIKMMSQGRQLSWAEDVEESNRKSENVSDTLIHPGRAFHASETVIK